MRALLPLLLAAAATTAAADETVPADAASAAVVESHARYQVPEVQLLRADGVRVALPHELDDGRPVLLNFIFTSCSSICPLASQTFEAVQRRLGPRAASVHLVSISIDPEQDTPQRLRAYARKFHAGPGWQHYTGTLQASLATQRAFDAFRGDKMSHTPLTLLRAAPGEPWLRLEGFVTADELLQHVQALLAAR